MRFRITVVLLCSSLVSCRDATDGVRTQFVGSYAFSATERRTIARIAGDAAREARGHLPSLAPQIILQITSGNDVIPELGTAATIAPPEFIRWTVDSDRPEGVVKIAETSLREALFHEFIHLVRGTREMELIDHVVDEGLATAFERDVAGASPLWGQYPDDAEAWVEELLALKPSAGTRDWEWMRGTLPDGRRWVGMRAGTFIVDQAMQKLNRTSAQLATMPTDEILAGAGFPRRKAAP